MRKTTRHRTICSAGTALRWCVGIVAALLLFVDFAVAADGVQVSPDGKQSLANKAVASERWAISRDREDGSVTGNVFRADGGDPQFVWCDPVSASGDKREYRCFGADGCSAPPCGTEEQWSFVSEVTLPDSFFLPSGSGSQPTPKPSAGCVSEPGQIVRANGSDWVIVEVPVIVNESSRRFALRYPVRLDGGLLASPVELKRLRKVVCQDGGCAPTTSICGYASRVFVSVGGEGSYRERDGERTWSESESITLSAGIEIDSAYEPLFVFFSVVGSSSSREVTRISEFNYSLIDADYPQTHVDLASIRAELETLLQYIMIFEISG